MTLTTDPRRDVVPPGATPPVDEPRAQEPVPDYAEPLPRSARRAPLTPRRLAALAATWILVTLAMPLLVLYGFGPLLEQRAQRSLLSTYRTDIRHAAGEADTPFGVAAPTTAPSLGAPVGIMEIGKLRFSQVTVEGVGPEQTRKGPGHVPGTAGLGQPGNAAVVGRRAGYGGPFSSLGSLHVGDAIVVTTVQGQTLYKVSQVRQVLLKAPASASSAASSAPGGATALVAGRLKPVMTTAELYAPSNDNRLTAVTSRRGVAVGHAPRDRGRGDHADPALRADAAERPLGHSRRPPRRRLGRRPARAGAARLSRRRGGIGAALPPVLVPLGVPVEHPGAGDVRPAPR